jgi:ketosteroid isomerase-like protein
MRTTLLVLVTLLCPALVVAQSSNAALQSELLATHAKWMKAFYTGDNPTMDQVEANNLVLVLPMGAIWVKDGPRLGKQGAFDPQTEASLSEVAVRRFGETAILTGILQEKSAKETVTVATTVVFAHSGGKWKIVSAQWTPVEKTQ